MPPIDQAASWIATARHVAALTGAGVSAESGIPTFRGLGGVWRGRDPMSLATPEAFARDPATVWAFYNWRRDLVAKAEPNPGHHALARLAALVPRFTLVTQKVERRRIFPKLAIWRGLGNPIFSNNLPICTPSRGIQCTIPCTGRGDDRASGLPAEAPPGYNPAMETTNLSAEAMALLLRHVERPELPVDEANRGPHRELARAGIMVAVHTFSGGRERFYRFTREGWDFARALKSA